MSSKKVQYSGQKTGEGGSGSAKRPKISNRRPQNRYELEKPSLENVSTSAKKLSDVNFGEFQVNESFGYRILNFLSVFSVISQSLICKKCKSDITFTETGKRGLGFKIIISCKNCDQIIIPSCPFIEKGYDINRRIVLAMRLLGIGLNGIIKFCAFMDLPRPIFQSFYDTVVKKIAIEAEAVCKFSMKTAAKEEQDKTDDANGISVSGDGSWRKRGFSSLYGFVSLIGWHTGKVVDVLVKSKYCKICEYWKKKSDTTEFEEWNQIHKDECQANHVGSAGKMEVDAVIEMFQRSESLYNLKYANYVGDGDSKTFKGILEVYKAILPIYGELSSDDLLTRCLGGFTQNSNESLNATVWSMAPKSFSSGKHVLDTAVYIAAGIYNNGLSSVMKIMEKLGLTIGPNCYNFCVEADARRIKFSEKSLTDGARETRQSLKSARKEEEDSNMDKDGQMYGAGIAD